MVLTPFNLWNWGLSFYGMTTIEFWLGTKEGEASKGFISWKDNIFLVFGTYKIFRVLSPSLRSPPFTGIEWSFYLADNGYSQDGFMNKEESDLEMVGL